MKERLFGMETEYGLTIESRGRARFDAECTAGELLDLARQSRHLPGLRSSGIFLPNGSRFYVDCGHPELATPECTSPWDVCRYLRAGEQFLLGLAGHLPRRVRGIKRALILRNNTDYASCATWGCHESYLHSGVHGEVLSRQIIPHLVSRLIFSGAGGFDCYSPGVAFLVSPRVPHLRAAVSGDSTGGRVIFHTRNEPLCGNGYRRLHILCGESLCGELGAWLKIGTTALVVALIEAGKQPGQEIDLPDPLAAMRLFAADPGCGRSVTLANGREVTALDIQDHYLRQAEAHADAKFMPPWAGEVCQRWRAVLNRLRTGGSAALARSLDWAAKRALFQNHLCRRGTTFEALANWTRVMEKLAASSAHPASGGQPITTDLVLASRGPMAAARKLLTPFLQEHGLAWNGLDAFLALRLELFEIDTRFGILGDSGIFTALDRSGVLDHRLPGVDNIPHALENPPAIGRAAMRGACIGRFAGEHGRFACEWDGVFDLCANTRLDLTDPFCVSEQWEPIEDWSESERADLESLFRTGRYAEFLAQAPPLPRATVSDLESIALSYARLGRATEALAILDDHRHRLDEFHHLALSMWILSNGFVPDVERLAPLIAAGEPMLQQSESDDSLDNSYTRFVFLLCKGIFLMQRRLYPLAEAIFTALLRDRSNAVRTRMCSRTKCYLAELNRRLGRMDIALQLVQEAAVVHRAEHLAGDLADHSLPILAKLSKDDSEAGRFLEEAEATQRLHGDNLGLARVLCIRARRLRHPGDGHEIELLQRTVPVLAKCDVARKIVREWRSWISPRLGAEPADYWGL